MSVSTGRGYFFSRIFRLKIRDRIIGVQILLFGILVFISFNGYEALTDTQEKIKDYKQATLLIDATIELRHQIGRESRAIMEMFDSADTANLDSEWKVITEARTIVNDYIGKIIDGGTIKGETINPSEDESLKKILNEALELQKTSFDPLLYELRNFIEQKIVSGGKNEDFRARFHELDERLDLVGDKIMELFKSAESIAWEKLWDTDAKVKKEIHSSLAKTFLFVLIGLIISVVLSFFLVRATTRPINTLVNRLREIASGEADLTKQLKVRPANCSEIMGCGHSECPSYGKVTHCWNESGSFAETVYCPKIKSGEYKSCEVCKVYRRSIVTELDEASYFLNGFIERIRQLVKRAKGQSEDVTNGAHNLTVASEQMAAAAGESRKKAVEIQEETRYAGESVRSVAAAMEEMTATVSDVAQHTAQARSVAEEAREEARHPQEVI